jgi:hypothetical protein
MDFEKRIAVFNDDGEEVGHIDLDNSSEGHRYFFPQTNHPLLTAEMLRAIADKLDELNGVKG